MGQKVHPISLRLGKFKNWDFEYFSKFKLNLSKLIFQNYQLKNLLLSFFYNKNVFVHSMNIKHINNIFFLTINVIPTFLNYKFVNLELKKNYYYLIFNYNNFLKHLFIKLFSKKLNYNNCSIFFNKIFCNYLITNKLKKKYSYLSFFNTYNFLKNYHKSNKNNLDNLLNLNNFYSFSLALSKFKNLPKIIFIIKDLSKLNYLSDKFIQKNSKSRNFDMWVYYFYIMFFNTPSAYLVSSVIKKFFENRSQRKKQRFFFNNLRKFLYTYRKEVFFNKIQGIKIEIKGKMNGRDRSSLYRIRLGSVPLSTISSNISYAFLPAFTIYGSFGIKVWIATKIIL